MNLSALLPTRARFLAAAVLLCPLPVAAAQSIPVTTTSESARTAFEAGRDRLGFADIPGAKAHFDAALAADPGFGLAHLYRAITGPESKREQALKAAQAAKVSDAERQMISAYAAQLAGDREREVNLLKALVQEYPGDAHAEQYLGFQLYLLERHEEAIAAFQRAIAARPNFVGGYNMLGYACMAKGDDAAAERAFREAIRLAPKEANPHDSLGEFYLKRGRYAEATAEFKQAVAIDASFQASQTNLVRVAIEQVGQRFTAAVANKDAGALAALYTSNGSLLPPNEKSVTGRAAVQEYWQAFLASADFTLELQTAEVFAAGNTATEICQWKLSLDGEVVDSGRCIVLYMKDGDRWLMHRDIWNSERPVAAK